MSTKKAAKKPLEMGELYYLPNIYGVVNLFVMRRWSNSVDDQERLAQGLVFRHSDGAEEIAEAMLAVAKAALDKR